MPARQMSLTNFDDLPLRWQTFLRREFRGSATAAARGLDVSRQTAHAWLTGAEPRGRHLARAVARYPAAREAIFGET